MVAEKEPSYQKGTETKYRLRLVLMDKSGRIETNVWDEAEAWNEKLEKGSVIEIRAQVTSYKDKLDLRINSITPVLVIPWILLIFSRPLKRILGAHSSLQVHWL